MSNATKVMITGPIQRYLCRTWAIMVAAAPASDASPGASRNIIL